MRPSTRCSMSFSVSRICAGHVTFSAIWCSREGTKEMQRFAMQYHLVLDVCQHLVQYALLGGLHFPSYHIRMKILGPVPWPHIR
jgi:hypothetical protein